VAVIKPLDQSNDRFDRSQSLRALSYERPSDSLVTIPDGNASTGGEQRVALFALP
jgi:hypothetical protein